MVESSIRLPVQTGQRRTRPPTHSPSPKTRPSKNPPSTNTNCNTTSLSSPPTQYRTIQVQKASPPRPTPWPTTNIYCTTASFPPPTLSLSSTMRQSWSHHHVQKLSPLRPRLTHLYSIKHHGHIQKHIKERKHSTKEITQRLAEHYELGKLSLKWNDFQEKILASFQELRYDREFTLIWVKKFCLSIKQKTC